MTPTALPVTADCPVLIRYADDFVVHCHTRQDALEVKAKLAAWLAPRGLAFNEDKTRVVSLDEGFDFLGFNVRRYHGKLLIKPSKAAIRRIRERLRDELRSLRGSNAQAVIKQLNPIIRGWANYYRTQVSAAIFADLDVYLWKLTYKWATSSHANKPKSWVVHRYFGQFNKARQDRWVFGDRHSGAYMHRFAWTNIVRHLVVKSGASPDDPALADYWAWRRRKPAPADQQHHPAALPSPGRPLPDLQAPLFAADQQPQTPSDWEQWLTSTRTTITIVKPVTPDTAEPPSHTRRIATARPSCPPTSHQGLLEPDAGKPARPVLKGARRRKAPGLPDTCETGRVAGCHGAVSDRSEALLLRARRSRC